MIIFVGGLIGAGKSSVAKGLAEHLDLPYYDVDARKHSIYAQDPDFENNLEHGIPFSAETRKKLYDKVISDFAELAGRHEHMVVDETLHKQELRQHLFDGARRYFHAYIIVWVKAKEEVIVQRLTSQVREGHLLKDPLAMHNAFLKEFEPFRESIIICRNDGPLVDTITEISNLFDNIAVCSGLTRG